LPFVEYQNAIIPTAEAVFAMDDYLDNAMDGEDVFPCKGCGEVSSEQFCCKQKRDRVY
jgi:hypothetical protein